MRRVEKDLHRTQGMVVRWNRTRAEPLFEHQYAQEMRLPEVQRSTEWVTRLPAAVKAWNKQVTRLTGKNPSAAIKVKKVAQNPSLPADCPAG